MLRANQPEDENRVVPHAVGLEGACDVAHNVVQDINHGEHKITRALGSNWTAKAGLVVVPIAASPIGARQGATGWVVARLCAVFVSWKLGSVALWHLVGTVHILQGSILWAANLGSAADCGNILKLIASTFIKSIQNLILTLF